MRTAMLLLAAGALALTGCRNWEERHTGGVVLGGATGAALGALVGSAAGNWGKGAVIGAGAGALTGYLVAESTRPRFSRPPRRYEVEHREVVYRSDPPSEADRRQADAEAYFQRGLWAEDEMEAERLFKKSIDLYPSPPAYNNLGLIYIRRGEREEARRMWRKALDLDPDYHPARENLRRLNW